jgi:hypothetical protein
MTTACPNFVLGTISDPVCASRGVRDPEATRLFLALIVAALAHRTLNPK